VEPGGKFFGALRYGKAKNVAEKNSEKESRTKVDLH